ncbi:phosphoribosylglycinamide formyltransferase [Xylophilus sp. GOD-11R]|uniref:phosphoribosylglycinamide formyltransferase n=1 Tax=Xylophilus sp. GOD-11R TaxID=3089814 RepID=UPI00298CFA2C|nr:phosphoribosylglycinamide formyltransferase [Xylophilus sp. GOD-11R]WPB55697.1 phosphoribosylglycinamide formyltransferase [Xylophilus sp. GOD-11R]
MNNVVILISGSGSNMRAIVQAALREDWSGRHGARIEAVISNKPDAEGLAWAREAGIAAEALDHRDFASREAFDEALMQAIDRHSPALLVLAGFMRILGPAFVWHYQGRMVNIHPSLLPSFTGLHTHRRALEAGCTVAGATVHRVTADLDLGPILGQAVVPVLPGDTPEALAARVLAQEHRLYPRVLAGLLADLAAGR